MGLFSRKMKDPVEGTAQVVATSAPPDGTHGACEMNLVVQADGVAPVSVEHTDHIVSVRKWPNPGTSIPVQVDRADPTQVKVLWDRIPNQDEVARAQADALAASMWDETVNDPAPADASGVVSQLKQMFPGATVQVQTSGTDDPEAIAAAEQALGIDLDGDGRVAGVTVGAQPASAAAGDDRIAQVERLARLRDQGALSAEEFEAEKRRVLGGK